MKYLKAEHLKFKRTFTNKLLWVAPFITALFAWFVGGFVNFQCMTFYWWYAFLLPGTIAILCASSHRKEESAGKYYSVYSMPIDLAKFEMAKNVVLGEKLLVAGMFLAVFTSVSNVISPALAVYSIGHSIVGSMGIILTSVWQIPLCLYLARKIGFFLPVILNAVLCICSPIALGNSNFWWIWPYCWSAKFAEPVMGIAMNGTYDGSCYFSEVIPVTLVLSISFFIIFAIKDAKLFTKEEGK